ncbi:alanine/glycine:cation symporter family protein [Neisseria shayeganii]|uniref:AGSC family alanine:sodium (Na+) symporter n=1 Tax=Neisseria shayeganii 871 TaxID=1032488 RepID=G4CHZ5_9NEIS|nr:sodium:alanine symporter family protein [Neisseria shayeganii]EGY52579.1 AGSC family alanine:sodium (Na+) symporter [Neisseria shayeganii 871]
MTDEFIPWLTAQVNKLNGLLWNEVLIILLIGTGLFFTLYTGFVQIRMFAPSVREMLGGRHAEKGAQSITPFQAFVTGLASRVGMGNVVGVSIAITSARNPELGLTGAGAVFWMWITALVGMSSAFAESSLAQLFKVRDAETGRFRGGPAYYISQGLKQKWMAVLFSLSLIATFGFVFNALQANVIADAAQLAWGIDKPMMGGLLVLATAPIIFGGIKRVAQIASGLVPFMAALWLLIALYVIITNIGEVPRVFELIVSEALDFRSVGSGFLGGLISIAMMNGVKRGLYSNEAGMGSAPNAAAAADTKHPASQGLIQMLGVFVDTLIICSCSAFIILLADNLDPALKGAQITQAALQQQIGSIAPHLLAVLLFLFAFTTIIGNYAYAESNVQFMRNNPSVVLIFRLLVLGMVFFGAAQELGLVLDLADLSMGIMALINLIAILWLSPYVKLLLTDYRNQLKRGKTPEFKIAEHPGLNRKIKSDIW